MKILVILCGLVILALVFTAMYQPEFPTVPPRVECTRCHQPERYETVLQPMTAAEFARYVAEDNYQDTTCTPGVYPCGCWQSVDGVTPVRCE